MPKETYERFRVKYTKEFDKIRKEMATCGISISNLKEMINEAVFICQNLRQLWQDGGITLKEALQNLLFPNGLVYDKKNGAFRTPPMPSNCRATSSAAVSLVSTRVGRPPK